MKRVYFIFLFFLWVPKLLFAQEKVLLQSLNSSEKTAEWSFQRLADSNILPATVPGSVYTDLLQNQLIPDPFFGQNEKMLKWVDTCAWVYICKFYVDSPFLQKANQELVFEGLDTYCELYLNGQFVRICDNMFRKYVVNVGGSLLKGENVLQLKFYSAEKIAKYRKDLFVKMNHYELPEGERVFLRKAQYQFGWDFAPRFLGVGVWRSVNLRAWDDFLMENVFIETEKVDSVAHMKLHYSYKCEQDSVLINSILLVREKGSASPFLPVIIQKVNLRKGDTESIIEFDVPNPKLWWTNDLGRQPLYELHWINAKNQKTIANSEFGIRTIELVQSLDSANNTNSASFYFKLNGKPVYMKGANYVPMDVFPSRVTHAQRAKLLSAAKEAHMNMIRIWGGGIYESDDFYSLCDSLGIMVWQDFMYACAMYPKLLKSAYLTYTNLNKSDEEYEWRDNYSRIEKHPCIAIWCGNNEIEEGWWNWGWQRSLNYTANDSASIWHDYQERFQQAIPDFLKAQQSRVPYVSSSPQIGWGHPESLSRGDSHYWGVWWGMEPYETYAKKVPRFASEFGMQSWPCYASLKNVLPDSSLNLSSPLFTHHQKHPTGQANLEGYLKMYGLTYNSFKDYLMATQLLQADAMKTALEAQRLASPRCMGSVLWQLNDCWPGASWSLIDYYGEKKKAYYRAQECFVKKYQTPLH
jgi:beta-mannosidase